MILLFLWLTKALLLTSLVLGCIWVALLLFEDWSGYCFDRAEDLLPKAAMCTGFGSVLSGIAAALAVVAEVL